MNALRHGLAAVLINTTTSTGNDNATVDDSGVDAMYHRLRQIEVERLKVFNGRTPRRARTLRAALPFKAEKAYSLRGTAK